MKTIERWQEGKLELITAQSVMGHWVGYVELPPEHPWRLIEKEWRVPSSVHGGCTFIGVIDHIDCNPREDAIYVGFDGAHGCDSPDVENEQWATDQCYILHREILLATE